jgi:dTDP-4-amino-4,6-dideoxygalactose transaminase
MMALGVGQNDETVTSPITFSASANCALYVGAIPKFVDINDTAYHLDVEKLKDFLKKPSERRRVKAVIPVHFMGTVSDVRAIKNICDKYRIKIVEDAAHALGAECKCGNKWLKVGHSGHSDITIFSFHPIKHITTGEGGAVLTNNKDIYERALRLRHHGIFRSDNWPRWRYDISEIGFNYRITDFQCALGISQMKRLNKMVDKRRRLVRRYNHAFSGISEIRLPQERKGTRASYHLYVIRVPADKRNLLYDHLRGKGILTQVNYIPVHLLSFYKKAFGYKEGDFPVAERYYKECLSLPLYPGLSERDQARVINEVRRFFRG